jgi:hypothetical protein
VPGTQTTTSGLGRRNLETLDPLSPTYCDRVYACVDVGRCAGVDNGESTCTNTCFDAFDGFCDDGGLGSDFALCPLGTDCADCGPR